MSEIEMKRPYMTGLIKIEKEVARGTLEQDSKRLTGGQENTKINERLKALEKELNRQIWSMRKDISKIAEDEILGKLRKKEGRLKFSSNYSKNRKIY
jgi:hypothetical protein